MHYIKTKLNHIIILLPKLNHIIIFHFMAEIKVIYQDFVGTKIWEHFRRSTCGKLAQCKLCKKTLKCEGGSTKGLHMHIRSTHQIEVLKRKIRMKLTWNCLSSQIYA